MSFKSFILTLLAVRFLKVYICVKKYSHESVLSLNTLKRPLFNSYHIICKFSFYKFEVLYKCAFNTIKCTSFS